jgi:bifunctional non-homologous end joining protein LigD
VPSTDPEAASGAAPKDAGQPLAAYRRKRDFAATPEPAGRQAAGKHRGPARFVVHKHAARALHYDLRLEIGGVYASWAVPKGPSLDPAERRLAIHVEDHPLEYGEFEGTIPKGEYGGGTVMIWDRGTFTPIGDAAAELAAGHLKFVLDGTKLHGRFALVKMKPRPGQTQETWLLIKDRDDEARLHAESNVTGLTDSAATGRTMEQIEAGGDVWDTSGHTAGKPVAPPAAPAAAAHASEHSGAVAARLRIDIPFQLATLVDAAPEGDEWIHEVKYDGYRLHVAVEGGRARIRTRSGQDWTDRFPGLAKAAEALPVSSALMDGEAVVFDADGRSQFGLLQEALSAKKPERVTLAVFDLLYLDGFDLRREPLVRRKELLEAMLESAREHRGLLYAGHVPGHGEEFHDSACSLELEGSVSKRADRPFVAGRSRDWLKAKCSLRQEFVIGGWTDPAGSRAGFGALLLGVYDHGVLRSVGRVGTGFTERVLADILQRLRSMETDEPPLAGVPRLKGAHWVRPELLAEVTFREWTREGVLRQPLFEGLREDKDPKKVVREGRPAAAATKPARRADPAAARSDPPAGGPVDVAGTLITNPDKILQPAGVSKVALARYYASVADAMLPYLENRLLTILRCPHGAEKSPCFYQKHPEDAGFPGVLHTVPVMDKEGPEVYFHADDLDGLLALAQLGALEIHTWNSLASDYDTPDRIVFDLDPGPGTGFAQVAEAAGKVHTALDALEFASFVKTTGGHGLHVVTPIVPEHGYDTVRTLAHALVEHLAANDPSTFTAKMAKRLRPGRVFVDYLRNAHGATAVCAYSTRARPGGPVSVPVTWKEVADGLDPAAFDTVSVPKRLARRRSDPWRGYEGAQRRLDAAVFEALGLEAPAQAPTLF